MASDDEIQRHGEGQGNDPVQRQANWRRFSKPDLAHAAVVLLGVAAAAWFFFATEDPLWADFYLIGFILAGEAGGQIASHLISE